jgi:hypothetical protein
MRKNDPKRRAMCHRSKLVTTVALASGTSSHVLSIDLINYKYAFGASLDRVQAVKKGLVKGRKR